MDSRTAFSDSNDFSNASSTSCLNLAQRNSTENFASAPPDVSALVRLSDNLDSVFESENGDFYADAKIVVAPGKEIPVHRCILASRSPYLKSAFASQKEKGSKGGGVRFELKELARDYEVGFDALVTVLAYLYSGKIKPLQKDICVCVDDNCSHLGCRPAVEFMAEVLYLAFTFQITELVSLYQRRLLEILEKITPDDLLIVLSVADLCKTACERLHMQCAEILVRSDVDNIALEKLLPMHIANLIMDERKELAQIRLDCNIYPDKHVKRIHRALDSDDVELVMMLLKEGHTTLDDAFALHYAVQYCDVKTASELLELGLADVNCMNERGFSVLHVAAMRKEPKIIISLLTKGARPTEVTPDGRKALQISKRLTKAADWFKFPEEGKSSHKDRLCIEILEQAERREPMFLGEGCVSLARASEDMRSRLLYLENRVGLARYLFPEEAKVAMEIAQVDGTTEFTLPKETVDLNEAPFLITEEHRQRMKALENTGLHRITSDDPKTLVTVRRKQRPSDPKTPARGIEARRKREKQHNLRETNTPANQRARSRINFKVPSPKRAEMESNSIRYSANRVSPRNRPWAKKAVLFPNPLFNSSPTSQRQRLSKTKSPVIAKRKGETCQIGTPHKFVIKLSGASNTKFQVRIRKKTHIGTYDTPEEAADAYSKRKRELEEMVERSKKKKRGGKNASPEVVLEGDTSTVTAINSQNSEESHKNNNNDKQVQDEFGCSVINSYGQLIGEYSRIDEELWLTGPRDHDECVVGGAIGGTEDLGLDHKLFSCH